LVSRAHGNVISGSTVYGTERAARCLRRQLSREHKGRAPTLVTRIGPMRIEPSCSSFECQVRPGKTRGRLGKASSSESGKGVLWRLRVSCNPAYDFLPSRHQQPGSDFILTAVTFLTLRAVMPRSPPCLASMAASFMRLGEYQCMVARFRNGWQRSLRLHEEHVVQKHLSRSGQQARFSDTSGLGLWIP
jgi:hypothetical protein